jgi:hypothetical protein
MRRTPWRAVSVVLVLTLALASCDGPSRGPNTQPSAASGFFITVTASPNVLRDGDTAVIQVKVSDTAGRLVDGALVTVTASPADQDENVATGTTIRGIFTTTYRVEGVRPGTAIITATVEDAVATTLITITSSTPTSTPTSQM